ncbi:CehA/McbA family metallohydrolase [Bacillota bacterium Meth-B3]
MIAYKSLEMHSHTLHSDGTFTVEALCRACKARELDGVALTDHNTMSGWEDLLPSLEAETLPVVRGIEWTTFYGHMLVLGADEYVDWRLATPDTIDDCARAVHAANGVVGIAHPYALGSPFCTGCHWEFNVRDWRNVDYVEVWSEQFPVLNPINELALQFWTDLLNRGHRLAAANGRDWHGRDAERFHMPVTYLGVEGGVVNTRTARDALRAGRTYVTSGPALSLAAEQKGRAFGLGESLRPGDANLRWALDTTARAAQWEGFGIVPREIALVQNGAPVAAAPCGGAPVERGGFTLPLWPGWLRLEVLGDYMGKTGQLLAFTSPIYVDG